MKTIQKFNLSMVVVLAGLLYVGGAIAGNDASLDTGFSASPAAVTVAAK